MFPAFLAISGTISTVFYVTSGDKERQVAMASEEPPIKRHRVLVTSDEEKRVRSAIDTLIVDQVLDLMFALMKKDILSSTKEGDKREWEGKLWTEEDEAKLVNEEKRVLSLLPAGFTEKEILEEKRYLNSIVPETSMTEERAAAELQPIVAEYSPMAWLQRAVNQKVITGDTAEGIAMSMSADMMLGF